MSILKFLKLIFTDKVHYLKNIMSLSKLSAKHPTCQFDLSSQIVNCDFGCNVRIFDNNKMFNVKVGSFSYIQTNSRIFNSEIGKFCSIAASVSIAPGKHDIGFVTTNPALTQKSTPLPKVFAKKDNIEESKKVTIGNDVWIGEKVIILDGVCIGNGAVIASGAVVNKDVEPYSVVGGIPAKHIKFRFDKDTIDALENSKWWDFSDEWFEHNHELMLNPADFIQYLKNGKKSI